MFGAVAPDHDTRYERSAEFVQVLQGGWEQPGFGFPGRWLDVED